MSQLVYRSPALQKSHLVITDQITHREDKIVQARAFPRTYRGFDRKQERKSVFVLSFRHFSDSECAAYWKEYQKTLRVLVTANSSLDHSS